MGRRFLGARHSNSEIASPRRISELGTCLSESPRGVGWGLMVCMCLCLGVCLCGEECPHPS